MADPKEKEKLQAAVNRGNLVDIALREVLNGYFTRKMTEKVAVLVAEFSEKKSPTEMLSTIAAISSLVEMENDLKVQVSRRDVAHKRMGEIENESNAEGYREY
jgi:hypothetical protein